jgi:hypothetical protein
MTLDILLAASNRGLFGAVENLQTWLQLIIMVGSVVTMVYSVSKLATKPNQTQNDRLDALERWREDVDRRLERGTDHFRTTDDVTKAMVESQLAIMDALISIDGLPTESKAELLGKRTELYRTITDTKLGIRGQT